jgi:hypothetical protein
VKVSHEPVEEEEVPEIQEHPQLTAEIRVLVVEVKAVELIELELQVLQTPEAVAVAVELLVADL